MTRQTKSAQSLKVGEHVIADNGTYKVTTRPCVLDKKVIVWAYRVSTEFHPAGPECVLSFYRTDLVEYR